MTRLTDRTFGVVGALAAFPRRLAAREVERQGGALRRGVTRMTSHVVFARGLLETSGQEAIGEQFANLTAGGRHCLSENAFLRVLGLMPCDKQASLSRQAVIDKSGLAQETFDLLVLFDSFEQSGEAYSFRDLILAKKYADLTRRGIGWSAIARSIHRAGPVASLTALSLHTGAGEAIYARRGEALTELDGQMLLSLDADADDEMAGEELFADAEEAESEGRFGDAAAQYARCLTLDPGDCVAAFNRANCLRAAGLREEAAQAYMRALKLDPRFAEAWFNLAGLSKDCGGLRAARDYLARAIALDKDYADAIYNLATVEYESGRLGEAKRWWMRYLELDANSEWAKAATRGIRFIDLAERSAG